MTALAAAVIATGTVAVTFLGWCCLRLASDADDAIGDAWTPDPDLEAARLHDRFVAALDVDDDALACYGGQCRTNVRDGDDEFDRKHYAREAHRADDARKVVAFIRDRPAAYRPVRSEP